MRSLALALAALAASGCVVYETRPYRPPPPAQGAPPPDARLISENEAVNVAFDAAHQRGLQVDRVRSARLDGAGRWHVDLAGRGDRARLLIDARSGRLLKGKFRAHARDEDEDDREDD